MAEINFGKTYTPYSVGVMESLRRRKEEIRKYMNSPIALKHYSKLFQNIINMERPLIKGTVLKKYFIETIIGPMDDDDRIYINSNNDCEIIKNEFNSIFNKFGIVFSSTHYNGMVFPPYGCTFELNITIPKE